MTSDIATPPGSSVSLDVQNGRRTGVVLARIKDRILVEYYMPDGHTALVTGYVQHLDMWHHLMKWQRLAVGYKNVPQKWLRAMKKAGTTWKGYAMGGTVPCPLTPRSETGQTQPTPR